MNAHGAVLTEPPAPVLYVQPATAAPTRYVLSLTLDWYTLCQVLAFLAWLGLG